MLLTGMDGYAELITVLVIFVVVLAVTALVTKYIARYQKTQGAGSNIEVLETRQLTAGKYIQLVRIGDTYAAIAVCKDTVTMLCQIPKDQICTKDATGGQGPNFKELLGNLCRRDAASQEPEGEQTNGCDQ
ncbi:MAG: flagellar biosynthetic protein FliO [Lachnospiraceae bacterium]|nr:flagellar biosynthetic protein FliO [Lachnospiraceae bacterium]